MELDNYFNNWDKEIGPLDPGEYYDFPGEKIVTPGIHCEYHIDYKGFRNRIQPGGDVASGCSYTFGYGVNTPWPEIMGVYNLGTNSASNDYIVRSIISYCRTFKPANVYVCWTSTLRREHWTEQNENIHVLPGKVYNLQSHSSIRDNYVYLQNDYQDRLNFQKNRVLLYSFCQANNIQLYEVSSKEPFNKTMWSLARDGQHPGPNWHQAIADYFQSGNSYEFYYT